MDRQSPSAEAPALARRYSGQLNIVQQQVLHYQAATRHAHEALRTVRRMAWNGEQHDIIAGWISRWIKENEA